MAKVIPGRYTAHMDGPFVVFVIGFRINKWWAVHKWLPVMNAMPPMLQELYRNREELGFMDGTYHLSGRGLTLIQYWRSFEHLEHYARQGANHLKAWRDFNRKVGTGGDVGIFHETYLVQEDQYECLYNNMPRYGLAKAGSMYLQQAIEKRQAGGLDGRAILLFPHLRIRKSQDRSGIKSCLIYKMASLCNHLCIERGRLWF